MSKLQQINFKNSWRKIVAVRLLACLLLNIILIQSSHGMTTKDFSRKISEIEQMVEQRRSYSRSGIDREIKLKSELDEAIDKKITELKNVVHKKEMSDDESRQLRYMRQLQYFLKASGKNEDAEELERKADARDLKFQIRRFEKLIKIKNEITIPRGCSIQ